MLVHLSNYCFRASTMLLKASTANQDWQSILTIQVTLASDWKLIRRALATRAGGWGTDISIVQLPIVNTSLSIATYTPYTPSNVVVRAD